MVIEYLSPVHEGYVHSGRRTVECTPAIGYTADRGHLIREAEVTRGSRAQVTFILSRI